MRLGQRLAFLKCFGAKRGHIVRNVDFLQSITVAECFCANALQRFRQRHGLQLLASAESHHADDTHTLGNLHLRQVFIVGKGVAGNADGVRTNGHTGGAGIAGDQPVSGIYHALGILLLNQRCAVECHIADGGDTIRNLNVLQFRSVKGIVADFLQCSGQLNGGDAGVLHMRQWW